MLDFDRLRVLIAVAEQGSMTGAAAVLCRTQPAVSRQIAALERQVGTRLLVRDPSGTRLTSAGELLVIHARGMMDRMRRAEAQLAALKGEPGRGPRIGSFGSANTTLVPHAVFEFIRRHPRSAPPVVSAADPETHVTVLRSGELDLALVTEWDLACQDLDGIELIPLVEDELLLALARDHPRARGRVRLADVRAEVWIDGAHPDCLGPLEGLLGGPRDDTDIIQCDDWTAKQGLVAYGAGVMLFPALARHTVRPDIVLTRLDGELPRRRIYLACPEGGKRVQQIAALIDVIQEAAQRWAVSS
ncbi:LysR family transcriptional regulator [Streptomyces javensis]|uniref:LysR family transcriptional regulator n=1 Tax=Streptomyces javensis TaxID=114698 RepID=UPI0033CA5957